MKNGDFGLSETPDSIGKKGWDAACERIVTWAVLKDKVSGREIAAFNTHFDHVGKVARRESAVLILEKIKQMAGDLPVIVIGDFNWNGRFRAGHCIDGRWNEECLRYGESRLRTDMEFP